MIKALFFVVFSSLLAVEIQLGDQILNVDIADTFEKRRRGLMGKEILKEGEGMLFVYPSPQHVNFWMKNTLIPLSIGFFNRNRWLVQIIDMTVPKPDEELKTYSSDLPVQYALEVPLGWFKRHGIKIGDRLSLDRAENSLDSRFLDEKSK